MFRYAHTVDTCVLPAFRTWLVTCRYAHAVHVTHLRFALPHYLIPACVGLPYGAVTVFTDGYAPFTFLLVRCTWLQPHVYCGCLRLGSFVIAGYLLRHYLPALSGLPHRLRCWLTLPLLLPFAALPCRLPLLRVFATVAVRVYNTHAFDSGSRLPLRTYRFVTRSRYTHPVPHVSPAVYAITVTFYHVPRCVYVCRGCYATFTFTVTTLHPCRLRLRYRCTLFAYWLPTVHRARLRYATRLPVTCLRGYRLDAVTTFTFTCYLPV